MEQINDHGWIMHKYNFAVPIRNGNSPMISNKWKGNF